MKVAIGSDHAGFLYNLARSIVDSARRRRNLSLPVLSRHALADDPFTAFDEWRSPADEEAYAKL